MSDDDKTKSAGKSGTRREAPATSRNTERFERQAAALRENLRRRNRQRRAATAPTPDKPEN